MPGAPDDAISAAPRSNLPEKTKDPNPPPQGKFGSDPCCLVRITGVEPARRRHQILSLARLPIPPYPHLFL